MNWNNAGGSALARLDYRHALADFLKARQIAQTAGKYVPLAITMNNLASLYLQMGNPAATVQIAMEALANAAGKGDPTIRAKLRAQLATALSNLHRFGEAEGFYGDAVEELKDQGDFDTTARVLANWGGDALVANRLDEAENVLSEALLLIRIHHLTASASVLRGLANVKGRRGDMRSAAALFKEALDAPQSLTPRWTIFADRAQVRLDHGDLHGALADFREAHRLAMELRADIVPADQDRVSLESGLSPVEAGLVESGNRLALRTSDPALVRDTFDAAEQNRLWSLRALVPASNDWRTRLPKNYRDLLGQYQAIERSLLAQPTAELRERAAALQIRLQEFEACASEGSETNRTQSALAHVRSVLDPESVLFSFYLTQSGGWLWTIDHSGVVVHRIPGREGLEKRITDFTRATRQGDPRAITLGEGLYQDLFGAVPARYLAHRRWLLELDGPLFDLPFASLVVDIRKNEPIYLVERAALQMIPSALMLEPPAGTADTGKGEFLGVGDPIYNGADPRYNGDRKKAEGMLLPRLTETGAELQACSRAWGSTENKILTGRDADVVTVRAALDSKPSVIHFATHIIAAPADHASGLIALSLDRSGAMGLMGPNEIVAHPVTARLVVLNGCYSGQGDALPGSGLMGLTRAWIGAGARSVLATRWDIPDEAGRAVMVGFYEALRAHPDGGAARALQQAQLTVLTDKSLQPWRSPAAIWAAYFLLGRE